MTYSKLLLSSFLLFGLTSICSGGLPITAMENDLIQPGETSECASDNYPETEFANDVETVNSIIKALYDVISGDKGVKRDWDRFLNLFHPEAKLVPSGKNKEGITGLRVMTPEGYRDSSGKWLEENGFHEIEIKRIEEQFGSLVHCWSTYESRRSKSDIKPFARGINSIQLMHDGSRWWIVQIYWLGESSDNTIPEKYLPGGN